MGACHKHVDEQLTVFCANSGGHGIWRGRLAHLLMHDSISAYFSSVAILRNWVCSSWIYRILPSIASKGRPRLWPLTQCFAAGRKGSKEEEAGNPQESKQSCFLFFRQRGVAYKSQAVSADV